MFQQDKMKWCMDTEQWWIKAHWCLKLWPTLVPLPFHIDPDSFSCWPVWPDTQFRLQLAEI